MIKSIKQDLEKGARITRFYSIVGVGGERFFVEMSNGFRYGTPDKKLYRKMLAIGFNLKRAV